MSGGEAGLRGAEDEEEKKEPSTSQEALDLKAARTSRAFTSYVSTYSDAGSLLWENLKLEYEEYTYLLSLSPLKPALKPALIEKIEEVLSKRPNTTSRTQPDPKTPAKSSGPASDPLPPVLPLSKSDSDTLEGKRRPLDPPSSSSTAVTTTTIEGILTPASARVFPDFSAIFDPPRPLEATEIPVPASRLDAYVGRPADPAAALDSKTLYGRVPSLVQSFSDPDSCSIEVLFQTTSSTYEPVQLRGDTTLLIGREKAKKKALEKYKGAQFYSPSEHSLQTLLSSKTSHCKVVYLHGDRRKRQLPGYYLIQLPKRGGAKPTNPLWAFKSSKTGKKSWETLEYSDTPIRLKHHQRYCIGGLFHFKIGPVVVSGVAEGDDGEETELPLGDPPSVVSPKGDPPS